MRFKSEFGFIQRVQLCAARQIAFDLCRLGVPLTARTKPGPLGKTVIRIRLWLCHCVLR